MKSLGALGLAAALIVLGVVGLARITIPDEPTFSEGLEEVRADEDGSLDFIPTAIGGELEVTGAREGTITLEGTADGPTYGLGNSKTTIFFETDPLTISQMSHDGLAFFPEPDACEFTERGHNEELGVAAMQVSCPELVDIRDNGTISLEGYVSLPADMVLELDLPDTGGTVTVGDVTFEPEDPFLFIGPTFEGGGGMKETGLNLFNPLAGPDDEDLAGVYFSYDRATDTLTLSRVSLRGGLAEISGGECETEDEQLAVVNPQTSIWELTFSCDSVDVSSQGALPVEGTVVYHKSFFAEH